MTPEIKKALDLALDWQNKDWNSESPMSADLAISEANDVINALMQAIAAPVQEPYGYWWIPDGSVSGLKPEMSPNTGPHPNFTVIPLYTTPPAATVQEPDLSGLRPHTQKAIKSWIADGTFVERAIGALQEQELENMRLEKLVAAQPVQEPVAWQPIRTAPQDGTKILGWNEEFGARETQMNFYGEGSLGFAAWKSGKGPKESGWNWSEPKSNWGHTWNPTHWKPLLTPLYTTPPAAMTAVPLTDKQKSDLAFTAKISQDMTPVEIYLQGIADSEAAHGITKGNTP